MKDQRFHETKRVFVTFTILGHAAFAVYFRFDGIIITPPVVYAVCFCFAALSMKTGGKSFRNAAWCGAVAAVASVFLGLEPQFAPPERFVAYAAVAAAVLAMTTLCLVFTAAGTAKIYAERFPRSRGKAKTCIAAAAIPYAAFAVAAVATFSTEYVWVASVLCAVKSAAAIFAAIMLLIVYPERERKASNGSETPTAIPSAGADATSARQKTDA